MEVSTRIISGYNFCELTVKSHNTSITEDVSNYKGGGKYEADENVIEQLFTSGFEISRFNGKSDVTTVKMIFENYLSDREKLTFIELITDK